jgi:hypothetical protein
MRRMATAGVARRKALSLVTFFITVMSWGIAAAQSNMEVATWQWCHPPLHAR